MRVLELLFCFIAPSKPRQHRLQYYCSQSQINDPGCHQNLFKNLRKCISRMVQCLKKVPLTVYFDNTDRLILQMKTTKPEAGVTLNACNLLPHKV